MFNKIVQVLCFLVLLALLLGDDPPVNMDDGFILQVLLIDAIALSSFLFIRREKEKTIKRQYIRIVYLFLIGFIIVHFQAYIDYVLGNLSANNLFLWIDRKIVCKASVISSLGLVCYMMGYSFNEKNVNIVRDPNPIYLNVRVLNIMAAIFLAIFFATVNKDYLDGHYGDAAVGGVATIAAFVFEATIYSLIVVHCRNCIIINHTKISFISYLLLHRYTVALLFIYLLAVMFSGDRGPIIYCSLAFLFGYIYITKKKVRLATILVLVAAGAIFITILGEARRQDRSLGFISNITSAINQNNSNYYTASFSEGTEELASSVRTVHLAVSKVPKVYPHFYGLFFAQDIMLFVPAVKGTFIATFNIPKAFTSSAQFLTFVNLGSFATWGVGTSCIADTYLDFGVTGVIIVFFLFGYFTRKVELVAFSNIFPPAYLLIFVFLIFSFSIYISRSTIMYSLSKFTYVWLFTYIPLIIKRKTA